MKTSELTGAALDWAVAQSMGLRLNGPYACFDGAWCIQEPDGSDGDVCPSYSTDWDQGGPIIERETDCFERRAGYFYVSRFARHAARVTTSFATIPGDRDAWAYGPTLLVAAMRCYVASKLGDEVEVPEELT